MYHPIIAKFILFLTFCFIGIVILMFAPGCQSIRQQRSESGLGSDLGYMVGKGLVP